MGDFRLNKLTIEDVRMPQQWFESSIHQWQTSLLVNQPLRMCGYEDAAAMIREFHLWIFWEPLVFKLTLISFQNEQQLGDELSVCVLNQEFVEEKNKIKRKNLS